MPGAEGKVKLENLLSRKGTHGSTIQDSRRTISNRYQLMGDFLPTQRSPGYYHVLGDQCETPAFTILDIQYWPQMLFHFGRLR